MPAEEEGAGEEAGGEGAGAGSDSLILRFLLGRPLPLFTFTTSAPSASSPFTGSCPLVVAPFSLMGVLDESGTRSRWLDIYSPKWGNVLRKARPKAEGTCSKNVYKVCYAVAIQLSKNNKTYYVCI